MNENRKKKIAKIKETAKAYAPTIITFTAAAGAAVLASRALIKSFNDSLMTGDESDWTLPVIDGEEKEKILGREDSVLQKIEDDVFFLSFPSDAPTV